ncbi:MAG TPA: FixH family protein [Polyangiaceae bacterium]|nr:FixH family protein [Polyangiaceae bacterium]
MKFWHGALLPMALGCGACSSSKVQSADVTVASASGALRVKLHMTPDPPTLDTNAAEITVTRTADGTPVDGLTVTVMPWMPAMNHGSSNPPVMPAGDGKYEISSVYLYMSGLWDLKTAFSGPITDHVVLPVQIP